jgi:hypothetical protein
MLFIEIINGIKDNKLISRPSQTLNQELAEIAIKVLKITIKKKNSLDKLLNI